jgi:hypothetical protein
MLTEREGKFLEYCKGLERNLENGKLRPSKGLVAGGAVSGGEVVDLSPARFSEIDRKESEGHLRYIESEGREFPGIVAKYRGNLDEAIRQYKTFIG